MNLREIPKAKVILNGNFELINSFGQSIEITEKKGRALLAMLASETNMRRSRSWLMAKLWSRTDSPQNAYSLRQTVHKLRRLFGPKLDILHSNRGFVWLEETIEISNPKNLIWNEFFEDAPHLDRPFREWVEQERRFRKWQGSDPEKQVTSQGFESLSSSASAKAG